METDFTERWNVSGAGELCVAIERWQLDQPFGTDVINVWSSFDHHDALEEAGFEVKEIQRVRDAFLAHFNLEGRFGSDPTMPPDISVIVWSQQFIVEKFTRLCKVLVDEISQIGADDGFYDYYPDYFSTVDQIYFNLSRSGILPPDQIEALGQQLNMVRQIAFCLRYSGADDWHLIQASADHEATLRAWLRRGWLIQRPAPEPSWAPPLNLQANWYFAYMFTPKFWVEMNMEPVPELTTS